MTETTEIIEQATFEDNEEQWFKGLSWTSRIQGYLIFTALAFFSTVMGWIALGIGYYWKYSVLSTLGSLMSLASTFIIMGPQAQLHYMFDEYRRISSLLYIGSLILTIFVAISYKSTFLCIIFTLLQYGCLIWYSLSYVPYGQETVVNVISRLPFR